MHKSLIPIAIAIGLIATGCVAPSSPGAAEPTSSPVEEPTLPPEPGEDDVTPTPDSPVDEATGQSSGEVPSQLFDSVIEDAITRSGLSRSEISVVKAEAVTWSDGSLGCPQPDMIYTQALVDGYQVILEVGGVTYDYHLSSRGHFVLCNNALPDAGLIGTPTE